MKSGDYLVGAYTLATDEEARKVVQYPVVYTLNEVGGKRIGKALSTVVVEAKKEEKKDPQVEFDGKLFIPVFDSVPFHSFQRRSVT